MVYEYLNLLTVRNGIADDLEAMPAALEEKVQCVVLDMDGRYRAVTVEDGGVELGRYWWALRDGRETRWWWMRKPRLLPYGW